jgi:hypothetical protein
MTSITSIRPEVQHNKSNCKDENTSDDSLLLMADDFEDKAPLLNIIGDDPVQHDSILSNDIPLQLRSTTLHCHVPEEKFDYAARNRLIAVLILCIIFMIIEIVGTFFLYIEFNQKKNNRFFLRRWCYFELNSCSN